ncbi:MAG: MAC/perforin domain-containing protein [Amaricoccus sp.]
MTSAAAWLHLPALALALGLLPGAALSQQSLAGDWRPRGDDTADPVLAAVDCAPADEDCQEEHGTFVTSVYLRIVEDERTGAVKMTSSGPLSASLTPRAGKGRLFDIAMASGGRAALHLGSAACGATKDCFEIVGTTDPTALSDGVYVPVVPMLPDKSLTMSLKDRFGSVPANMDLAGHCYDITKMGLDSFADSQGCRQQIFQKFGEMDPHDYVVTSYGDEKMVAIPYGWKYLPIDKTYGANSARILESASDVSDSHQRTIGVNVGLGLGPVSFSASQNTATKQLSDAMYQRSLTYSEYHYIKTDFALVVDKANVVLSLPFYTAITQAAKAAKPDFRAIIDEFGTHYAYATTMGERGKLVSTITEDNVVKLHDEGVDISSSMSASMSVPIGELGEAKASGGVSKGTSDDLALKMAATLGDDYGNYVCEGGVSCNGQNPSGGVSVPVLLDLRPLSDLLAPPFFPEIDNLPALRAAFAQAIAKYAFGGDAASTEPAARFLRLSEAQTACDDTWNTMGGPEGATVCLMTGVTVAGPVGATEFAGSGKLLPAANSRAMVLPAASGATLTGSAMVTEYACSPDGSNPNIALPRGGTFTGTATGQATLPKDPNEFAADNWHLKIDMIGTECGEGYYPPYDVWLDIWFDPVSAAQVLMH